MSTAIDFKDRRRAARVVPRVAPQQKVVARAFGVSDPRVSRWSNEEEDARYSPFFHDLRAVRTLCAGEKTSPWPHVAELAVVVVEEHLRPRTTEWLIRRAWELADREDDAERDENRESRRRGEFRERRETWRDALVHEAFVQLEQAAIDHLLEERRVDWQDYPQYAPETTEGRR